MQRGQELGNPWFIIWDKQHSNSPRSQAASQAGSLPSPAEKPEQRLARLELQARPRWRWRCHDELQRNEPGEPAGNWCGWEEELDTVHQLPPGKRPEERGKPEPRRELMLPDWQWLRHCQASWYFPPKGKEAEEASYTASRAQARPAVLRATTLQQRHRAAKAIFTSFLTKKCFPRSWQQSLRSSIILPMAVSCPLPGYRAFAAQTSVSLNILFYSLKPKDMKEYLKHFTENVNVMVSRDLRSLINPCLGITNTYLVFERRLEVSTTSSSKAGQSESTSGNLQTYSKASLTVWRLLLTLDILASVEACPVSPTSWTFSSSPQQPFTWPETFTHPHQAEKDQAPYTSAIASLQLPLYQPPSSKNALLPF